MSIKYMKNTISKIKACEGQLLLEILVAVGVGAIILSLGGSLIYTSLVGSTLAGERDVALGLFEELHTGVRAFMIESWQNISNLTKGASAEHHPVKLSGAWVVVAGNEVITLDSVSYTRFFTVQNVCRGISQDITGITDSDGVATTCITNGGAYDASTERIVLMVRWGGGNEFISEEYITRWRNQVCVQGDWTGTGSVPVTCPSTEYESSSNLTTGGSLEICAGGC